MDAIYKSLTAHQRDLLVAAYLQAGIPKTMVSRILAASKPAITGALTRLRNDRKLREEIWVDYGDDQNLIWMNMRSVSHEEIVRQLSVQHLNALVVPRPRGESGGKKRNLNTPRERERTSRFHQRLAARFAAQELLRFLLKTPDATVGISFGYTLEVMVEEFERLVAPFHGRSSKRFSGITVFNYTGDFGIDPASIDADNPAARPLRYCSSSLCARLAQALRTKHVVQCHLPGWIPLDPDMTIEGAKEARRQASRVFERYDSYCRIFGSPERPKSLLRSAHVLITGIGSLASVCEYLKLTGRLKEHSAIVAESLRNAAGDMSGAILQKGAGGSGETPIAATFIGPTLQDFRDVSGSARQSEGRKMGVLAVAAGAEKAEALDAAIRAGVVDYLSIDTVLCEALLKLREAPLGTRPSTDRRRERG